MHIKNSQCNCRGRALSQRGDTMIEILITIIVIAVGVLGAAALQVTTLKNLSTSHSSTVAALVADDIGERMRANVDGTLAGDYERAPSANPPDCVSAACSPSDLAAYDIATWSNQMRALLPSASGEITRAPGSNTFVITVRWDEDRSGSTGDACPPQSDSDLECYRFSVTM